MQRFAQADAVTGADFLQGKFVNADFGTFLRI